MVQSCTTTDQAVLLQFPYNNEQTHQSNSSRSKNFTKNNMKEVESGQRASLKFTLSGNRNSL